MTIKIAAASEADILLNDPEFQEVAGGPYIQCKGGDQCRGANFYIIK